MEDPKKSTWAPGKSVRIIFPAEELRQKFLNLGAFTSFGNMSQFVNMFPLPITAQSVKNGVDIPRSFTGDRPMMAGGDAGWTIKYATLSNGGGFDLAIFADF